MSNVADGLSNLIEMRAKKKVADDALEAFKVEGGTGRKVDFKFLQEQKEQRELEPFVFDKDRNFNKISSGVLNMTRIANSLKNPTSLLFYLLQWKGYKNNGEYKKGLTGEWYKKGFIAASQSVEQMSANFDVDERTIRNWIKALEADRLIVIEKCGLKNVYVLGRVNNDGTEQYFYCGDIPVYRLPKKK
jgi:hypothetical protein